jgi:hypothetical protein
VPGAVAAVLAELAGFARFADGAGFLALLLHAAATVRLTTATTSGRASARRRVWTTDTPL